MDILQRKLHGIENQERSIDYTELVLQVQSLRGFRKARYINYIIHGINEKILSADKLFYKSVILSETVEECDLIGLCIRFGADIHRFYNDKNIIWYVMEKFQKTNRVMFIFITCMLLVSGMTYNDHMFREGSDLIHTYFSKKGLQIFYPRNIIMENQKKMNLFLDCELNNQKFSYTEIELVENLCINLIRDQVVKRHMKDCEDTLIAEIINSGSLSMFMAACESSYMVSYFSMERLRIAIMNASNDILRSQLVEIVYYLNSRNILFDEEQYNTICQLLPDVKFVKRDNTKIKLLLEKSKKLIDQSYVFSKFEFRPSYLTYMNEKDLENLMYKLIIYKSKEGNMEKVLNFL